MALAGVTRLHGAAAGTDRSVRPPARRGNPRQAAVLRHRDDARRRGHRACWSKATKAGRPRSKAIPIIRRARARPTCSRRARCSRCTIRIARRRSCSSAKFVRGARSIAAIRGGLSAQSAIEGRRPAHPHRDRGLADAGGADPAGAGAASEREVDPVGAGQPRQRARRRARGVRPVRRAALRLRPRPTSSSRSTPTSCRRKARTTCATCAQFASRRRVEESADNLNRLYVVESDHTVTGGNADHRAADQVEPDRSVRARGRGRRRRERRQRHGARRAPMRSRRAVAKDLAAHKGRAVVMAGDAQPPAVHALAHAMNARWRVGATVTLLPTPEIVPTRTARRACASWSPTSTPAACRCW